jgi:hypothetical protein
MERVTGSQGPQWIVALQKEGRKKKERKRERKN